MRFKSLFVLIPALFIQSPSARAAVGLMVSPPAITNDYVGKITVTITGLAVGQQVQLKRFYDVNGNNVIDAGQDIAFESFKLADGQLPLIGGVRNRNVPGDDDGAANSQIQTKLNYPSLSTVATGATGNFIFKVEDTNGNTLATQTFSVAQKVYPQGVHGRVTSAVGGIALTNVPVALINLNSKGNATLTITDTNGNYSFYAPTNSYTVVCTGPGLVSDELAGFVNINTNTFSTVNISPGTGSYSISGNLLDASTGKPLGAVFINVQSSDNHISATLTDTNGAFVLAATSNQWKIDLDSGTLAEKGYLTFQNKMTVTVSNANVTGLMLDVPKATALIYGTVKDSLNNPVGLLSMTADDQIGQFEANGETGSGTNANYSLGVTAGNWFAGPDSDAAAALGFPGASGTNITISDGQAIEADFVLQSATTHLHGQVKDDHGNAITNIQIVVQPYPVQGNGGSSFYPTTDSSGNFDVTVPGGAWNIALECVSAQSRGYVDESGYNYNVTTGVDQNGLLLVFPQATATISGKLTASGGAPIPGITVQASQQINSTNSYFPGCVTTDANGNYQLKVLGGTWMVSVENNALNAMGYNSVSGTNVTIVGGTATANFVASPNLVPPKFVSGAFSATTGISLNVLGTPGHTNTVQYSSNLLSWLTLTNTVLSSSNWFVTDPAATNHNHRFYRAAVSP